MWSDADPERIRLLSRRNLISLVHCLSLSFSDILLQSGTVHNGIWGNLSKHNSDCWWEHHKTKGLISKTMTLHVQYRFWSISLQSSAKQREMTKFKVLCRTWTHNSEFSFFYLNCNTVLTESAPRLFGYIRQIDRVETVTNKSEIFRVIFKVTFTLALLSWLLKLPFQFTTALWKRNESSRKAMHLKYWPAAFDLHANFNLDKMTLRIQCQAPKCYPKWQRPMTNFLLLWRGISLGSGALGKLKQQSVTQLSVVFLLASTKNIPFWSDLLL